MTRGTAGAALRKAGQSFFPLVAPSTPFPPLLPGTPLTSSAFSSPLFRPHFGPPLFFSARLHSAPPPPRLPGPAPPLLFGRPPRQSPPPLASARPSPPPRLLERLRLPSRAALRFARSPAICQRSKPGGAARPAGLGLPVTDSVSMANNLTPTIVWRGQAPGQITRPIRARAAAPHARLE